MDEPDALPPVETAKIEVHCAVCGEIFQAPLESAGKSELCPACGALNDVLVQDEAGLDPQAMAELSSAGEIGPKKGVAGWVWWVLVIGAVAGFIIGIRFLFANTWEQNHLSELVNNNDNAEHCIDSGDFQGAVNQYQIIVGQLDNRRLESRYLQELLKTSQRRLPTVRQDAAIAACVRKADTAAAAGQLQTAIANYEQAIAMAPKLLDSSDPIVQILDHAGKGLEAVRHPISAATRAAVASTQKALDPQTLAAINRFQQTSEAFPALVSSKSFLFVDPQGKWRRRQYIVWDVTADTQLENGATATRIQLDYVESSKVTSPHEQAKDALADNNFTIPQATDFDHLQTRFVLESGKWVAAQRRRSDGQTWIDARDPQFAEKQLDHRSNRFTCQDLWQLEDQAFSQ